MFNNSNATRVLAVFMAIALAAGGALAAAPTIDTETTNTTTTSDVTDGDTMAVGFDASADNHTWIEASSMTENGSMELIDPDSGAVVYDNSTPDATDATNGHYAFNVTHDELDNIPVESGANETYTLRLYNDTSVDNPDTTNITVYIEGVEGRSVVYANEQTLGDNFDLDTDGFEIETLDLAVFDNEFADTTAENVAINGSNSTVTVHYANSSAADRLDTSVGDLAAGDWDKSTIVKVNDNAVKAYVNEAPDDVNESATYAVVDTSDNDVTAYTGDDYEGDTSVDVSVTANKGLLAQFDAYRLQMVGL